MFPYLKSLWAEVIISGIQSITPEREKREIIVLNKTWAMVMLIQAICLLIHLLTDAYRSGLLTAFYLDGLIVVFVLIRMGHINAGKIGAIVVINFNTIVMSVVLGPETHIIDFLLLIAIIPIFLFKIKERNLIGWGVALSIVPYALYHWAIPYFADYALPVEDQLKIYQSTPWIMMMCLAALLYLMYHKNARHEQEVKKQEEQLKGYSKELESRNADMHHFINATSHDLKTPLRTIASFLQLLQKKNTGKLDDDSLSLISDTIKSVKHLNQLISDIYVYAIADDDNKPSEITDLNVVVGNILKQSSALIADRNAVVSCAKLPVLKVSPANMEALFSNLIGNAIKYNTSPNPEVKVNCQYTDEEFVFSVADNGIGIKAEYQQQVFEIFKRLHTSAEYEGTGVGLAICHKIAGNYGGRMWVESAEGKGSTFYFSLSKEKVKLPPAKNVQMPPLEELAAAV
jgi:signal transduction histidine kinase